MDIAKFGAVVAVFLMAFILMVDFLKEGNVPEAQPVEPAAAYVVEA